MLVEDDRERRELVGLRDRVVHQAAGEELTAPVVHHFFHEPGADALGGASLKLGLDDHRIDGSTRIVNDRVREQADLARLHVDLDHRGVRAERPRDGVGIEVGARVEPWLAGRLEGFGLHRRVSDLAQAHGSMGHTDDVNTALLDAHVLGRALEHLGRDARGSLADLARGLRLPPVPMP